MCDIDDLEPFDFSHSESRTARKQHKCDCCNGYIKPKERYTVFSYKLEEVQSEKMCAACSALMDEFAEVHKFFTAPSSLGDLLHECIESREDFRLMLKWSRAMREMGRRRKLATEGNPQP